MALARLLLKNFQQRGFSSSPSLCNKPTAILLPILQEQQLWDSRFIRRFTADQTPSSSSDDKSHSGQEVAVSEGGKKKSKWLPKLGHRKRDLWRNEPRDVSHFDLNYIFPSGLGNAIMQATDNLNHLFRKLGTSSGLLGRFKEKDDHYKLKFEIPGLSKEDIKITVDDNFLTITGEHKEEEASEDEEHFSSYGYYNTSLVLPDDAKVDEIKAELKHGVLHIIIPKSDRPKKEPKEVPIH